MTSDTTVPATVDVVGALETRMDALPALDTSEVTERTLSRMMDATTLETLFASPESSGLADYAGRVITLEAVVGCLPSTKRGALTRYLVLSCTDNETGERVTLTTGSLYAATAALRAHELGLLPAQLRVLELESVANPGQTSLWLVKP